MIDVTTLLANPIPLPIIELQKANTSLLAKNKELKTILVIVGVCALLFIGYTIIKQIKEENEKARK